MPVFKFFRLETEVLLLVFRLTFGSSTSKPLPGLCKLLVLVTLLFRFGTSGGAGLAPLLPPTLARRFGADLPTGPGDLPTGPDSRL